MNLGKAPRGNGDHGSAQTYALTDGLALRKAEFSRRRQWGAGSLYFDCGRRRRNLESGNLAGRSPAVPGFMGAMGMPGLAGRSPAVVVAVCSEGGSEKHGNMSEGAFLRRPVGTPSLDVSTYAGGDDGTAN